MTRPPTHASELNRASFAWFALVSALLSTLLVIGFLPPVSRDPAALIASFTEHRSLVVLEAIVVLTWAVCSVPFVVVLGQLTRARNETLALSATILSSTGIVLLAYAVRTYVGAILAVAATGRPLDAPETRYQVEIWRNLFFFLSDPGLMVWGLGQFLFGKLAWKSTVLPNWLAALGMLGGFAGLLTDAVYQTGALALLQIACFATWGFVTGALLLRRSRTDPEMHARRQMPF